MAKKPAIQPTEQFEISVPLVPNEKWSYRWNDQPVTFEQYKTLSQQHREWVKQQEQPPEPEVKEKEEIEMSQVVKAITAVDLKERKVLQDHFSPLFLDVFKPISHVETTRDVDHVVAKVYKIGVTIGSQVMVTEHQQDTLQFAIERTQKQVIEAIFGEFRTNMMQIERALYDRDFNKARDELRKLERTMFSTE